MPNIRGSLVHIPRPAPKRGDSFKAATGKLKSGVKNATAKPRAKASDAFHNVASSPGQRATRDGYATFRDGSRKNLGGVRTEGKFGRPTRDQTTQRNLARSSSAYTGLAAGAIGGSIATTPVFHGQKKANKREIASNNNQYRANLKTLREQKKEIGKRYKLITDLGTKSGKLGERAYRFPELHTPALVGGATLGAAAGVQGHRNEIKRQQFQIKRQQTQLKRQQTKIQENTTKVKKNMNESAFGVDHGESVSKAATFDPKKPKPASAGRLAAGGAFGAYHGLVAGKGAGGKFKSAGTQGLGAVVGGTGSSLAAAALTRGKSVGAIRGASIGGSVGGAIAGTKVANNKGWLKPQKKV